MAQDPTYPLIPTLNFLGLILIVIPFSNKPMRRWNTGICMFAIYVAIMCLLTAIDTIIWSAGSYIVTAPIWCDIVSHVFVGTSVGIPACSFVISKRLCRIIRRPSLASITNTRRSDLIFDLSFTVGLPVLFMSLYYIVQGARFLVVEGYGCAAGLDESGLTIILMNIWPIILAMVSILFYSTRILCSFYHHRQEVNEYLASNQSTINRNDYFRVLILGCLNAALVLPITIYTLTASMIDQPLPFYPGWNFIHSEWEPFDVSVTAWRGGSPSTLETGFNEVINPILAAVFFLIFGTTKQARTNYSSLIYFVVRSLGVKRRPKEQPGVMSTINFEAAEPSVTASGTTHDSDLYDDVEKRISKQIYLNKEPSTHGNEEKDITHTLSAGSEC